MTLTRPTPSWAALLLLGVTLTACGADPGTTAADPAGGGGATTAEVDAAADPGTEAGGDAEGEATGDAGAACLVGSVDCVDTPGLTISDEPGAVPDPWVPVGEAVAAGIQGPFLVSGYVVVDGEGARLCEALLESLPPQCGGTSVPIEPAAVPAGVATTTEGGVTWTGEPVQVEGELVDGVFVVRTA